MTDYNYQNHQDEYTPNIQYNAQNVPESNNIYNNQVNQISKEYQSYQQISSESPSQQPKNQPEFEYYPLPNNIGLPPCQPVDESQPYYIPNNIYNDPNIITNNQDYSPSQVNNIIYQNQETFQPQKNTINGLNEDNKVNENKKGSKKRLICQIIMIIFLFLLEPLSIFCIIENYSYFWCAFDDLLIIILAIWMAILTKKGESTREIKIGLFSLFSLLSGAGFRYSTLNSDYRNNIPLLITNYYLVLRIVVSSYNVKCNCCCK